MEGQFDYSKVISQTNEISECKIQLSNQIKSLTQIEEECHSVWQDMQALFMISLRISEKENMDGFCPVGRRYYQFCSSAAQTYKNYKKLEIL